MRPLSTKKHSKYRCGTATYCRCRCVLSTRSTVHPRPFLCDCADSVPLRCSISHCTRGSQISAKFSNARPRSTMMRLSVLHVRVHEQCSSLPFAHAQIGMLVLLLVSAFSNNHRASAEHRIDMVAAAASSSVGPDTTPFLNAIARDDFFHFIEPSFSPFICSRNPLYMQHPIVLRLSDIAVAQLRAQRIPYLRVDVALFRAPDADTGTCPQQPSARAVAESWCSSPHAPSLLTSRPFL